VQRNKKTGSYGNVSAHLSAKEEIENRKQKTGNRKEFQGLRIKD